MLKLQGKKLCTTLGIWGAKSFLFRDLGGLAPPSPCVEPPLNCIFPYFHKMYKCPCFRSIYVFCLIYVICSSYFDHDAFMHHALSSLWIKLDIQHNSCTSLSTKEDKELYIYRKRELMAR